MSNIKKDISKKVIRTFRVHSDTFNKFKTQIALKGYVSYSEIIDYLICCFLKEPERYNPYKE